MKVMLGARFLIVAAIVLVHPAAATVITSLPGGISQPIPSLEAFGAGPYTFGSGITWTSTYAASVFGWTGAYDLTNNGVWSGTPIAGLNAVAGTMSYNFSSPISAFVTEINWANVLADDNQGPATLSAYNTSNQLIETLILFNGLINVVPPGYYGFQFDSNVIAQIDLSGVVIGNRNLSVLSISAIPEPSTWAMLLLGFAGIGFMAYRRNLKPLFSLEQR